MNIEAGRKNGISHTVQTSLIEDEETTVPTTNPIIIADVIIDRVSIKEQCSISF